MKLARVAATCLAVSALCAAPSALAAPSSFDPSYGAGGVAVTTTQTDTNGSPPYGGFAFLPDGSTFLASLQPGATNSDTDYFTVTRLTPGGTTDPSFGPNGTWSGNLGLTDAGLHAIAVMPNGNLFGTGYNGSFLGAFFHNSSASVYGGNLNNCEGLAATAQPNSQPIAVGDCGSEPVVTRFVGSPESVFVHDPGFNSGSVNAGGTKGSFNAATVDPVGRIVAVGSRDNVSGGDSYLIARYLYNGSLDATFHDAENLPGRVSRHLYEYGDEAKAVAIQPDGKIVVAGQSSGLSSSAGLASIARFNTDGSVDGSFGVGGGLVFHFGDIDAPIRGLAVQPNGKIVFVGSQYNMVTQVTSSVIGRLLSNGSFDESFAPGGRIVGIPKIVDSQAIGVGLQSDGKILVGELFSTSAPNYDVYPGVVRLAGGEVPAPVALSATITSPKKSKYRASKFKKFAGTAAGDGLSKVQISVLKKDSKLLKESKRCRQLTSNDAKFKKYKAVKKKCVPKKWLTATGTMSWSYKLKKTLKTGKYTLYVRSVNSAGVAQSTPTKKNFKLTE